MIGESLYQVNATILSKMHILECHVPGWLKKWGVGLGLMGEQGTESIHSFNSIEKSYHSIPIVQEAEKVSERTVV